MTPGAKNVSLVLPAEPAQMRWLASLLAPPELMPMPGSFSHEGPMLLGDLLVVLLELAMDSPLAPAWLAMPTAATT